jgi:septum formation protein
LARPITTADPRIWLASASPRRRELLAQLGLSPLVRTSAVPEVLGDGEAPPHYTARLARQKGEAVLATLALDAGPDWLLAADTVVVEGDQILEKPLDRDHARALLGRLSGRWHEVWTAFWISDLTRRHQHAEAVVTRVRFRALGQGEVERYIDSGEPMDKAGAYGIQGLAGGFVERVEGCYFNVVGLPIERVTAALGALGALPHYPLGGSP